jgi:hypothetical protein
MPIDDVISDYETSVSNSAYLSVRPADGDEWLVTHISMCNPVAGWLITSDSDTQGMVCGKIGGSTTADLAVASSFGMHQVRFLVSYSGYFRIYNGTGGAANAGYSAIKTKD